MSYCSQETKVKNTGIFVPYIPIICSTLSCHDVLTLQGASVLPAKQTQCGLMSDVTYA